MFISSRAVYSITKIRFCSSNVLGNKVFEDKLTAAEKERILNTLNTSNADELSKFKVTRKVLKNLMNWKNKKGPFTTVSEVLEVDGLGINILNKLCKSILLEDFTNLNKEKHLATNKLRKTIIVPTLIENPNELTCAVGLHIESAGISWAKLQKQGNELVSWNYSDFNALPKRVLPTDAFQLAAKIMNSIPPADIYILESKQSTGPNKNPTKATPHSHQLELTSMLIALLNTSQKHSFKQIVPSTDYYPNKIYYLKNQLPARLFGALVGTERVSIEETILNILTGNPNSSLPCSTVTVDPVLIDVYRLVAQ
ncbi:hypothetical protein Trydic_g17280 [Trypoxylus dichotomus]